MRHTRPLVGLALTAVIAAACGSSGPSAAPTAGPATPAPTQADPYAAWPSEVVLGLVPSREAQTLITNAKPLTDYLGKALSDMSGKTVTVSGFVPQDYTGLVAAMKTGQAQIGAFGPFSLLQARDEAGADIVLQSVRFGSATYHTQWFTNDPATYCSDTPTADKNGWLGCNGTTDASKGPLAEDQIAKIAKGTKVAFVEQASASGYIFPALQLINAGLDPEKDIQPIFAGSHDNSVKSVYDGDAAVGVSFDDARGNIADEVKDVGTKVVVFAYSAEIPNDGWAIAGDLPDNLKQAITQALLDYAKSEDGKKVLGSIYNIDDLQPADLEAFKVVDDAAAKVCSRIEC
jgi:phosphonate transport system substrate-binding protein